MFMRLFGYLFGLGTIAVVVVLIGALAYVDKVTQDLPDYEVLASYAPPVTTRVHAANGALMAEYAKEPRLYLPIQAIPDRVKNAFISAEDKMFYEHNGINFFALGKVGLEYGRSKLLGGGQRARGASTITQQVAKNFLLTNERSIDRKIKEAVLAMRIEGAYSKDKILELYLNEIYFGAFPRRSYGIASASLAYFSKRVQDLEIHEAAYLAALPKGPNNYHPFKKRESAIGRRNWVIGRMHANGYITADEMRDARAKDLGIKPGRVQGVGSASEYFLAETTKRIIDRYGVDQLLGGGLSVRTTLDVDLQKEARRALMKGLVEFDRQTGWRGPVATADLTGDWGESLAKVERLGDVEEWNLAVVLDAGEGTAEVGLLPGREVSGRLSAERETTILQFDDAKWSRRLRIEGEEPRQAKRFDEVLKPGDVVYVSKPESLGRYQLEQIPEVSGALVAMDPHTGRVKALVGGFSFSESQFNRATQAMRQPGSSFKPFVYAAALDSGYTPSSVVIDGPIKIDQGGSLGIWEPKNYGGKYAGPSTLRLGIEKSRNLMTIRLAKDMGMPLVSEYSKRFGIYDNDIAGLASSLGSRETTVLRMVAAYSVLANGGKAIEPSLIDRVQDRYGKTVFRQDKRVCERCRAGNWTGQLEPDPTDNREQVLDPMTAYQMTSMMEGVVLRGTAQSVSKLGRPIAGKTGTTNDERDAWFVGYSPDLVVGVFVGYDQPRPMGKGGSGGGLAAPIFADFMEAALKDQPMVDFRVPEGLKLYPINRKTGLLASAGQKGTIMEAFKPGTKPPQRTSVIGFENELSQGRLVQTDAVKEAVSSGTGGLY